MRDPAELAIARAKHGSSWEVQSIVNSWGDTMDDRETLAAIRLFNRTGSVCRCYLLHTLMPPSKSEPGDRLTIEVDVLKVWDDGRVIFPLFRSRDRKAS
ncbi:hypothetical protein [Mesorhizobium sp.]|uniref:hypothetical protein n=1 Tax=Mesorhizobium sp. TaxID=1871066 RepID=UPI000FE57E7A|nr:hypothetical protein [Mesorhizobium sp.]RWA84942.1 MAG: hypothetical protein EOQ32_26850 [Mesorhizobium sp.]